MYIGDMFEKVYADKLLIFIYHKITHLGMF
ncbi:MAG: hypothetical protein ACJA0H_000178 [Francisellaceae bacterium]|jgi:hypothetical protein